MLRCARVSGSSLCNRARAMRCLLIISIFVVSRIASVSAEAPSYDAIFVFGDSYCDVGNVAILSGNPVSPVPYYNGGSSNGPIWMEHVAGGLRLPLAPSLLGGTDMPMRARGRRPLRYKKSARFQAFRSRWRCI